MAYERQIHRRRSIRLPAYDYRAAGAYFITVCTYQRHLLFGDERWRVVAEQVWRHVTSRSRYLSGDEFVVMPNHVHGIVWITRTPDVGARHTGEPQARDFSAGPRDADAGLVTRRASPLRGSLGAIVGSFKSASARRINEMRGAPGAPVWQRNYYERVIRNDRELEHLRQYILDNPAKWAEDKHNPACGLPGRGT